MTQVKIRRKLSTLLALVTMTTVLVLPAGPAHALVIPVDCDMGESLQASIDLYLAEALLRARSDKSHAPA